MTATPPLRIGLTGGIGSGKSTVAQVLVARGATLVDTDAIARSLTAPGGAAIDAIREAFGADYIAGDGSLDRARMRAAAFAVPGDTVDASDPARDVKRRLEAILHPLIGLEADRVAAAAAAAGDTTLLVFDVPLLVESGRWRSRVDRVWLVDCSEALQVERVVARSGWTREAVGAVIARQASRRARRAAADAVIVNERIPLDDLRAEVEALLRSTLARGVAVKQSSA